MSALTFYIMAMHLFLQGQDVKAHEKGLKGMIKVAKIAAHKKAPGYDEQFIWSVERMCGLHRNVKALAA